MIEEKTRVILHTGDRLKWADGKTGTVIRPCDDFPKKWIVQLDSADLTKPPYGLAGVYEYEMEVILDGTAEPAKELLDNVNHPSHYTDGKYECIDYMEDHNYVANGYLFNAVKYISRAGKKDPSKFDEDLDKAVWYLKRMLSTGRVAAKSLFGNERYIPWNKDAISTDDYIQDKGLDGTSLGMALKLIEHAEFELAIEMLTTFRNMGRT